MCCVQQCNSREVLKTCPDDVDFSLHPISCYSYLACSRPIIPATFVDNSMIIEGMGELMEKKMQKGMLYIEGRVKDDSIYDSLREVFCTCDNTIVEHSN